MCVFPINALGDDRTIAISRNQELIICYSNPVRILDYTVCVSIVYVLECMYVYNDCLVYIYVCVCMCIFV